MQATVKNLTKRCLVILEIKHVKAWTDIYFRHLYKEQTREYTVNNQKCESFSVAHLRILREMVRICLKFESNVIELNSHDWTSFCVNQLYTC